MCEWSGVNADGSRFDVTEIRKGKEVEVKPVVVVEPEAGAETASETQPKAEAGTEISSAPATAPVTAAEVPSTDTVVDTNGTGDKPKGDTRTTTTATPTSETSSNTAAPAEAAVADPAKLQAMRQQVIGCVLQSI